MSAASDAPIASAHSDYQILVRWVSALTLSERIELTHGVLLAPPQHEKTAAFLNRWAQAFARGKMDALERRMQWDDIDAYAVALALDDCALLTLSQTLPMPSWAKLLQQALTAQATLPSAEIIPGRFRACRSPFVELWLPWVEFLAKQASDLPNASGVETSFWWDLKFHWLEQLALLGADMLYQRFQKPDAKNSAWTYRNFIKAQKQIGWPDLLADYPVLARQIGTYLQHALVDVAKLLTHWRVDRANLRAKFALAEDAEIAGFEALGDRHAGGAVARIRFSDACSLIYKPRDCSVEASWQNFIQTLNQLGLQPPLARLNYHVDDDRGWFSELAAAQATDRTAAARCFEQYGALVALTYLSGARDLHMDNVIVGADGPVLIDCETVLQPEGTVLRRAGESAMARAADALENSCLSSGLVRFPAENAAGERWDESALCGESKASQTDGWFNLGTDQLLPGKIQQPATTPRHRVRCNDTMLDATDFLAELCKGFESMVSLLKAQQSKAELRAAIDRFSSSRLRVVMRPTRSYDGVLRALRSAKAQRDGLSAGLFLETLARIWSDQNERPALWPLLAGENSALLQGEVPVLYVQANQDWIACEHQRVDGAWRTNAVEALRRRLETLEHPELLNQQLGWLRSSLQRRENAAPEHIEMPVLPPAPPMGAGPLRALVNQCGQQLLGAATKGHDGELSWMAPSYLDAAASKGRGVSHYLYDGSLGIAWFLAAAGRVLGNTEFTDAAMLAIGPVRRFLHDPAAPLMIAKEPLGIAHGLGSIIAGLTAIGRELGDSKLFEDAERAVRLVDLRDLSTTNLAELESGLAGALLGICRLVEASGARVILRSAKPLVARIGELFHPEGGWRGYDGHALAGFMHGQSGIAYALNAYALLANDPKAAQWADAAREIEDRAFVHAAGDWALRLDQAGSTHAHCMGTWCNGAPGILLTRMAYGRKPGAAEYAKLERAAIALHQRAVSGVDHLCCGTLGAALSLAELARLTGRTEGLERAREWLAAVAQAAEQRGRFQLRANDLENQSFQPGLYRGISGVGFAALTLAWPDKVGSVLRFEGFEA